MIVDAVNELKSKEQAEFCGLNLIKCLLGNREFLTGDYTVGSRGSDSEYWMVVCSTREYNQCIREMSEGAFVPDAKPDFVYGQEIYIKSREDSSIEWRFGCYSLDGESAIVLREGGYAYAVLDNISAKPLKTKEEIELEEAKLTQLNLLLEKHAGKFLHPNQFKLAISEMQKDGELVEILLPLESN